MLARWLEPILNPLACLPDLPQTVELPDDPETLLKRLEALLQTQLRYAHSGEKRSLLRGQGLDFADLREYVPGDDIRKIDWNVFARTLTPHIREYHEEKQLTLWLVVDRTASMQFGRSQSKWHLTVELAGFFALLANRAHHKLGVFLITQNGTQILPPKTSYAQVQHVMKTLLEPSRSVATPTSDPFPAACQQLSHLVQKQSTVIFLSDFLSFHSGWHLPLGQLSRHTQMMYLLLSDPTEEALPAKVGMLDVIDPETGHLMQIDTDNAQFLKTYQRTAQQRKHTVMQQLQDSGVILDASTDETSIEILTRLLTRRAKA